MRAFILVQIGQFISILGTGLTGFAIPIWVYTQTGSATALTTLAFFNVAPIIIFSPVAGAIVDRSNRKFVMMVSDLAAGLSTIVMLLLLAGDNLQIWHLAVTGAFAGVFQAFQFPAYSASITMMIPKEQYARASGMISLTQSASTVLSPILAASLIAIPWVGIKGILVIDIITFLFAVGALLIVHIPQPEATEEGRASQGSLLSESMYGFKYIFERPSLLGLQLVFFAINFIATLGFSVLTPMIMSSTGNDETILGVVMAIGSAGMLLGGLVQSTWGGPKRRVHGVLTGMFLSSLLGLTLLGLGGNLSALLGLTSGLVFWGMGNFFAAFFIPVINGSNQAIWQSKVAPDVQGRVFSARRMIAQVTWPVATLLAGPLADKVFEPALMPGGRLASFAGGIVGTGPGAGISMIFLITGVVGAVVGLAGYLFPAIRNAEELLPDHEAQPAQESKLSFAVVLVPLYERHFLIDDLADGLAQAMPNLCLELGWPLERLTLRPDYMGCILTAPETASQDHVVEHLRRATTQYLHQEFPHLKRGNPLDDFWAPGHLALEGTRQPPADQIEEVINQARHRSGEWEALPTEAQGISP